MDAKCSAPSSCYTKDAQQQGLHKLLYSYLAAGSSINYYAVRIYFTTKARLCGSDGNHLCGGTTLLKDRQVTKFNSQLVDLQGKKGHAPYKYSRLALHFAANNTFRVQGSSSTTFQDSNFKFSGVNWFDVLSSNVYFSKSTFSFHNYVATWLDKSTLTFRDSDVWYKDAMLGVFQSTFRLERSRMEVSTSGDPALRTGPAPYLSNTEASVYVSKGVMQARSSSIMLKNLGKIYFLDSVLDLTDSTLTVDGSTLVLFQSTLRLSNSVVHLKNGAKLFLYSSVTAGDAFVQPGTPIKAATLGSSYTLLEGRSLTAILKGKAPK